MDDYIFILFVAVIAMACGLRRKYALSFFAGVLLVLILSELIKITALL